jgi:hypothetical protein
MFSKKKEKILIDPDSVFKNQMINYQTEFNKIPPALHLKIILIQPEHYFIYTSQNELKLLRSGEIERLYMLLKELIFI